MTTNLILDRTAARFEALAWHLKLAALAAYAVVWMAIYTAS